MCDLFFIDLRIVASKQLADVISELPNFTEWRMLGLRLGLLSEQLDVIEVDYGYAGARLYHVLSKWLQRCYNQDKFGPPTWNSLASAVEQINPVLSITIRTKYCCTAVS